MIKYYHGSYTISPMIELVVNKQAVAMAKDVKELQEWLIDRINSATFAFREALLYEVAELKTNQLAKLK